MTDRGPLDDLFDFPTGQPGGKGRQGRRAQDDRGQRGLFDGADDREGPTTGDVPGPPEDDRAAAEPMDLGPDGFDAFDDADDLDDVAFADAAYAEEDGDPGPAPAPAVGRRWLAGLADLVLNGTALLAAVLAMIPLGLDPALAQWPGFLVFGLAFSFLYTTVPLAFWGQTPGMAWQGLRAWDQSGLTLSFSQTTVRWLVGLLTIALLGTPLVLAFGGRSPADRLSGSRTLAED